jgi:predicted nucleotidyltransferase component of viral defense system
MQDRVLQQIGSSSIVNLSIVLSGGTALARGWLHHRFSNDLDFFFSEDYQEGIVKIIDEIRKLTPNINIEKRGSFHIDIFIKDPSLKEPLLVQLIYAPVFYASNERTKLYNVPVDSVRNIISEKIAAFLSRKSPQDVSDLYFILTQYGGFRMSEIIREANSKYISSYGGAVDIPTLCRELIEFDYSTLRDVEFNEQVDVGKIELYMRDMADQLLVSGEFDPPYAYQYPSIDRQTNNRDIVM